ncbi:hypothetical protein [Streptomyces flavidovirens]|uniref:hypothetical protein n=1 Tax=Streptomyces flavidovirens TaxID=67298 RepID=UPI0012FEFCE8|nr:hypothetical protein [Streptomyces flavidovirens]
MGWAHLILPGVERLLEARTCAWTPSARATGPAGGPIGSSRRARPTVALLGNVNAIGLGFPGAGLVPAAGAPAERTPALTRRGDGVRYWEAVELLARAGFVDTSFAGKEAVPTAAFADGDVPRRQDL